MAAYQIKQSTTAYPLLFMMIDSTDHVTGKTGLTPTVTLSKAGAAFGAAAGSVSEIANGWYKVAGNATDSGTLGGLALHATATGADPQDMLFEVVALDPQAANATANLIQIAGNTAAATKLGAVSGATFTGVVSSDGTASTTSFTANTSGSTGLSTSSGFYSTRNSLLVFTSGNNTGKTTRVTGYTYSATVGTFTVDALPNAPATSDTFAILSLG